MNGLLKKYRVRIRNITLGLIFLALITLTGTFITYYISYFSGELIPNDRAELGQLGDYFGGLLNPVFGFLSFTALLVTIFYQSRELKLSRTELELTRKELTHSANALIAQNKAIELQSFEQTFFAWLNTYRNLIESISLGLNDRNKSFYKLNGITALTSIWSRHFDYSEVDVIFKGSIMPETVFDNWDEIMKVFGPQIEPLFKNITQLILWIDNQPDNKLDFRSKSFFVDIISSQLSNWELMYFYCYGLTDKGATLKPLLEKYCFFQLMNFEDMYIKSLKDKITRPNGYSWEAYVKNLNQLENKPA